MKGIRSLVIFSVLLLFTSQCWANSNFIVTHREGLTPQPFGEVLINGRVVFRFRSRLGFSPQMRAKVVAQRIEGLLRMGFGGQDFFLKEYKEEIIITAGDYLLLTVSLKEAKLAKISPQALGESWLENLKEALTPPTLLLSSPSLLIPLAESRSLYLRGTAKGEVTFSGYDLSLIEVSFEPLVSKITVLGKDLGKTRVKISREGVSTELEIEVKKYAGFVRRKAEVFVTGDPAPQELLKEVAILAAKEGLSLEPEATFFALKERVEPPFNLERGGEVKVKVPVKISGAGYITCQNEVEVLVKNESLPFQETAYLLVSNSPENFKESGLLSQANLSLNQPLRLLYHHKNVSSSFFNLVVILFNQTSQKAKVQVIKGIGEVSGNELTAGHKAAYSFLRNYLKDIGAIIEIEPKSYYPLLIQEIPPNKIVSGLFNLRLLEGKEVDLQVKAQRSWATLNVSLSPLDCPFLGRGGFYTQPQINLKRVYNVDGNWEFISLGDNPFLDPNSGKKLMGNYGVIYNIHLTLNNPTSQKKKVMLFFAPGGGVAQGTFVIEGEIIETTALKPPSEALIYKVTLVAGESRKILIRTMPQSGSCYPVRIVIHT